MYPHSRTKEESIRR